MGMQYECRQQRLWCMPGKATWDSSRITQVLLLSPKSLPTSQKQMPLIVWSKVTYSTRRGSCFILISHTFFHKHAARKLAFGRCHLWSQILISVLQDSAVWASLYVTPVTWSGSRREFLATVSSKFVIYRAQTSSYVLLRMYGLCSWGTILNPMKPSGYFMYQQV